MLASKQHLNGLGEQQRGCAVDAVNRQREADVDDDEKEQCGESAEAARDQELCSDNITIRQPDGGARLTGVSRQCCSWRAPKSMAAARREVTGWFSRPE